MTYFVPLKTLVNFKSGLPLKLNHYGLKIHACPSYGGGLEKQ